MISVVQFHLLLAAAALLIERMIGYPDFMYRHIRHPVVWIGTLIGLLDRKLNRESDPPWRRRAAGIATLVLLMSLSGVPAYVVAHALGTSPAGLLFQAVAAATLLAQRSLMSHVRAVETGLARGLGPGRAAVAMIVGRNPDSLDEAGVARAAIESLAENFSDGVVAPAIWLAIFGLPGIVLYKAINTADSMIGHRTARHECFGWAAARVDDVVNLPASRLSALFILFGGAVCKAVPLCRCWSIVRRDAPRHRSPNAGWPEAAMAAVLELRLAGPRQYGETLIQDPWMGEGRAEACASDIARALRVFVGADMRLIALVAVLAVLSGL